MDVNSGNVCRLCDKSGEQMYGVYDRTEGGKQILQIIKELLPAIVIFRNDPLSKQICDLCLENLETSYQLRMTALDTLNVQKEKLKKLALRDKNVEKYLQSIENGEVKVNGIPETSEENSSESTPLYCKNCKSKITEDEMINELQNAISESLKQSQNFLHENDLLENDLSEKAKDCKAKDNVQLNGILYNTLNGIQSDGENRNKDAIANRNAIENRGMVGNRDVMENREIIVEDTKEEREIVENRNGSVKRIFKSSCLLAPIIKRRKIGPKSKVRDRNIKELVTYEPHSLMQCALNAINKLNVPDYKPDFCLKYVDYDVEPICLHCDQVFSNLNALALHESSEHIKVNMFDRVDDEVVWNSSRQDADIRNKWFDNQSVQVKEEVESEDENDNQLLVPFEPSNRCDVPDQIVLVNGKPEVNGISLSDVPKEERRMLYKNITVGGLKRKFCPLCRFIFKDNWAIELHYFTSACHYTCRYCGVRFNKQRQIFDEHVQEHIKSGHPITKKYFCSRKKNDPIPRIIPENTIMGEGSTAFLEACKPKERIVKPIKMKSLFEKTGVLDSVVVKQEPEYTTSNLPNSNQAYFCRKCYKVFYELDEFNVHVTACTGTGAVKVEQVTRPYIRHEKMDEKPYSKFPKQEEEPKRTPVRPGFSSSGRPLRSCVRGTSYSDTLDIDVDSDSTPSHSNSPLGGFQCNLCSSVFPTIQSRNSHMRVHKSGGLLQFHSLSQKSHAIHKNKSTNLAKQAMTNLIKKENYSFNYGNIYIKQEPLEPEVEIHESAETNAGGVPSSIGNVSITPVAASSSKSKHVNPDIMKLVQNNPNITIRSMGTTNVSTNQSPKVHSRNATPVKVNSPVTPNSEETRYYRCSSCSKTFSDKSKLYFHKKNQCGGSRYPCPFCKKRFGTEAAYSSHIFYSHPE